MANKKPFVTGSVEHNHTKKDGVEKTIDTRTQGQATMQKEETDWALKTVKAIADGTAKGSFFIIGDVEETEAGSDLRAMLYSNGVKRSAIQHAFHDAIGESNNGKEMKSGTIEDLLRALKNNS